MKAIVNINYRDMQGKAYTINEIVGNRITLEYNLNGKTLLIDFNVSELQIIVKQIALFRNQAYRTARFVEYINGKGYVFRYEMPNGKVFCNIIKNIFEPNNYKTYKI